MLHCGHEDAGEHEQDPPAPPQHAQPMWPHIAEHDRVQSHGSGGFGVGVFGGNGGAGALFTIANTGIVAIPQMPCGPTPRFISINPCSPQLEPAACGRCACGMCDDGGGGKDERMIYQKQNESAAHVSLYTCLRHERRRERGGVKIQRAEERRKGVYTETLAPRIFDDPSICSVANDKDAVVKLCAARCTENARLVLLKCWLVCFNGNCNRSQCHCGFKLDLSTRHLRKIVDGCCMPASVFRGGRQCFF